MACYGLGVPASCSPHSPLLSALGVGEGQPTHKKKYCKLGCARVKLQVYLTILEIVGDHPGKVITIPGMVVDHSSVGGVPSWGWCLPILGIVGDHIMVGGWPSMEWWVTILDMVCEHTKQLSTVDSVVSKVWVPNSMLVVHFFFVGDHPRMIGDIP